VSWQSGPRPLLAAICQVCLHGGGVGLMRSVCGGGMELWGRGGRRRGRCVFLQR
jgi:hypothetical protein